MTGSMKMGVHKLTHVCFCSESSTELLRSSRALIKKQRKKFCRRSHIRLTRVARSLRACIGATRIFIRLNPSTP
jgi:hypothetical protein